MNVTLIITMILFLKRELNLLGTIERRPMPEIGIAKEKSDRGRVDHFIFFCRSV